MEENQIPQQPAPEQPTPIQPAPSQPTPPQPAPTQSTFVLPPHNDRMVMSIICTLFCCLIGGIIAIVQSSKSNGLYNSAMMASDDVSKQNLYYQSEECNKSAKTWITVSIVTGVVYIVVVVILAAVGVLAELDL